MKSLLATAAIAAVTFGASAASAQDASPWYVTVFGGLAFNANIDGQYFGSSNLDLQANRGFLIGGAFGTWLTPGFRAEIEVATTRRSVSDPNFMYEGWCSNPDPACDANGTLNTLYVLGNAWFHPFNMGRISPYVGIGAGMAVLKPNISLFEGSAFTPFDVAWNVRRIAPAAQLGIGAQFELNERITIDASYRMRAVLGGVFSDAIQTDGNWAASAVGVTYLDHGLQIGVTFGF